MKYRSLFVLMSSFIILFYHYIPYSMAAAVDPNRISLAISGGASMGAYEAGLIWGVIEILRTVDKTGSWSLGGEPRPIEISSIAGTSAGGINTLLAAMAWSVKPEGEGGFPNNISENIFRDVWMSTDVNRLMPPDADSLQYLPDDALLSRRNLVKVARGLRKKWQTPGSFRAGLRIPLGVTVTRVRPDTMITSGVSVNNQRFYIPFEMRIRKDGGAEFSFNPDDYLTYADPAMILMPRPSDGIPFSISDQQVEDALLATSAFPVGFGRKRLSYCRKKAPVTDAQTTEKQPGPEPKAGVEDLLCPVGYELSEAEFSDGGLFDNLPVGLARLLSESSKVHKKKPMPVKYIYVDPERERYENQASENERACEGNSPPEACRQMTFNLASEAVVLGGAIGTARKYELFRELTSHYWNLNLSQLSYEIAETIDAEELEATCASDLPYFDGPLGCSDRLRFSGRLLELAYDYHFTPIKKPMSGQALTQAGVATSCRPAPDKAETNIASECMIDNLQLRKQLANTLTNIVLESTVDAEVLNSRIRQSAMSIDSDRSIHVTDRGGPITGLLLGSFGAFLDYKLREYDYFVGVYDAVMTVANYRCTQNHPARYQQDQHLLCKDQLSQELYHLLGVAENPKSRYVFALMAKQEFREKDSLRYAYDPMPQEISDMRIIHEGLNKSYLGVGGGTREQISLLSIEREFFEHLKAEEFESTPQLEGGDTFLDLIMDDPEYWSNEFINRSSSRLVYLEKEAEAIYLSREPDPQKREKAYTTMMGASALALRTVTYKYPKFTFSPSTAPQDWFWRNIIPYEGAFDLTNGDSLLFWQPTWNFRSTNAGLRLGLGFTGGVINPDSDEKRENYGTVGLDLTRLISKGIFSGWGITPGVYHNWKEPSVGSQTSFGFDVHANIFKNRVRIGLGMRDVVHNAEDTIFLTLGIADLPGLFYWMSR